MPRAFSYARRRIVSALARSRFPLGSTIRTGVEFERFVSEDVRLPFAFFPMRNSTIVSLIRHGETDYNAQKIVQGHLDVPLNAEVSF